MVMVGRAAQERPWFPGQLARFLETGLREQEPDLNTQHGYISALYDEMLTQHGIDIGRKHARKHVGSALDTAAESANVSPGDLKEWRQRVLTTDEPRQMQTLLADAFAAFGECQKARSGNGFQAAA
jgi:tRNA-dihydrouridine synthase